MTPAEYAQVAADTYDDAKTNLWFDGDTQGIWIEGDENVLAFRGTEADFDDILRDLSAFPRWSDDIGTWCHGGFLTAAEIAWAELRPRLTSGGRTALTGHSLGGAIATLVGAMMIQEGNYPARLVTFGCPAVGYSGRMRDLYRFIPTTRFVNGVDVVPTVPKLARHVCAETHVGAAWSFWDRFLDPTRKFTDHRIREYQEAVG